jgi:hypothetical protein
MVCGHESFTLIAKFTKDLSRVFFVILVILVVFVLIVTGVVSTFDEWLQQEGREPRSGRGDALRPLQLPRASDPA